MGRFYFIADNYDGAQKYLEMALPLIEKYSEPYGNTLQWLGLIYMEKQDTKNQQRILQLIEEHKLHELSKDCHEPKCMLERAQYYASKGNTVKAKECYLEVLGMKMDDDMRLKVYDGYASLLSQVNDWASAANYKLMSASIIKKNKGMNAECAAHYNYAGLCFSLSEQSIGSY